MSDLVTFFAALADPTRLRLLNLMKDGEICVCFLQGVLRTNQPKVSRHLSYLRKAGLVEARQSGKWIHYSIRKTDNESEEILKAVFERLGKEPQISKDLQRLRQIRCCPARYGFSDPT